MTRTYCTKDYQGLSEIFFKQLSKGGNYTIDEAIKELGIFVQGYKKNEKQHNYWVNFKPFDNPKKGPESLANAVHFGELNHPEKSIYVSEMDVQKKQFNALENALYKYMHYMGMSENEMNKITKKIETRKNKMK